MKCIVADWEVRNLGCKTLEIEIDKNDEFSSVMDKIDCLQREHEAKYIVLKVPGSIAYMNSNIQYHGFIYTETQSLLRLRKNKAKQTVKQYERPYHGIEYICGDEIHLIEVKDEIKKGIFHTDRIALDPQFGVDIANRRYANWLDDEFHRGARLHILCYKKENIGFAIDKINDNKLIGILSGLYKVKNANGMGGVLLYLGVKEFVENDTLTMMDDVVSMNNLVMMKLHIMYGFEINKTTNIFIKHYL